MGPGLWDIARVFYLLELYKYFCACQCRHLCMLALPASQPGQPSRLTRLVALIP